MSSRILWSNQVNASSGVESAGAVHRLRRAPTRLKMGAAEWLVLWTLVILLTIRFFTERLGILPRMFNAIDLVAVPILFLCWVKWFFGEHVGRSNNRATVNLTVLFTAAWAIAWVANFQEVHWIGGLIFIAGLISPILLFLIITNFGFTRLFVSRSTQTLEALLFINLVVGTLDLLQAIVGGSAGADSVLGTFGHNPNQTAFFLAIMLAYRVAQWRYDHLGIYRFCTLVWATGLFLFNGFQTLWLISAIAAFILLWACGRLSWRTVVITSILIPIVVVTITVSTRTGWFTPFSTISAGLEEIDDLGKVELLRNVPEIWSLRPMAVLIGLGPGTFNSRAFRNIAIIPYGLTQSGTSDPGMNDSAAAIVRPFYVSEMSSRYIVPYFERMTFRLSGSNTDGPFTSYVSVPMEVGIPGAAAFFAIYGLTVVRLVRSLRSARPPTEQVLAAWALVNLLMILGIAVVDNYLEVTRYTLLVWLSVAMWHIQQRGRPESGTDSRANLRIETFRSQTIMPRSRDLPLGGQARNQW